jgi:SAM-dependent methyltransferase
MEEAIIDQHFTSDEAFDSNYPVYIRELSEIHWTPLAVIKVAARYLGPNAGSKVIDIGAGVGKFCIGGSHFAKGTFTGIEQRKNFVRVGKKVIKELGADRAELLHGNFVDFSLAGFDGIYFFNSFHENVVLADSLDELIDRSPELYDLYTKHLLSQLTQAPVGTRLATYWISTGEIPGSYRLVSSHFDTHLKLWVKDH